MTQPARSLPWMRLPAAILVLAAAAGTALGADPQWPASPDFPRGAVIENQLVGASYLGWTDQGGGWLTEAGPGWDEQWQLIYERDGAVTVAIVTPESYTADGSIETWRIATSLLMAPVDGLPMTREACALASGEERPIYARWLPGSAPSDVWTFDPQAGRFERLSPQQVTCSEYGPE